MRCLLLLFFLFLISCSNKEVNKEVVEITPIIEKSLNDKNSIHYANFSLYPKEIDKLPIGIIDLSGDGRVMLDAIKSADLVDNISGEYKKDNVRDLEGESFEVACDLANFPYSLYLKNGKKDLFRELVVKNALFLLGNKYYLNTTDKYALGDKKPCKILIVGDDCFGNIAFNDIKNLLDLSKTKVKAVSVMAAGLNSLFRDSSLKKYFSVIALTENINMDTLYSNAIKKIIEENNYGGVVNFIKENRDEVAANVYDMNFLDKVSVREFMKIHLTILLNKYYRISQKPINYIYVGVREYLSEIEILTSVINELREYKDGNGNPIYKGILPKDIQIINPFKMAAYECYKELRDSSNLALNIYQASENFYVSVPTLSLTSDLTDSLGNFTNEYKLNRECGSEEITSVFHPFSERYLNNITNIKPNEDITN